MAINKIALDGTTLIDLSTDTVASSDDIVSGKVGHLNDGSVVTGTAQTGGGGILPSEYQQVEYIESTGTQYIDTGFVATAGTNIEMTIIALSDTPTYYCAVGSYAPGSAFQMMLQDGTNRFSYYCTGAAYTVEATYGSKIRISTNAYTLEYYTNNRRYSVSNSNSHATTYSLGLFAGHESGGFLAGALMRLYSCRITDYNEIVREYYPCYRIADGAVGLYDIVNGVFYPNLGEGDDFTKGDNV